MVGLPFHESGDGIDLLQMHVMFFSAREPATMTEDGQASQGRLYLTCSRKGQLSVFEPHLSSALALLQSQDSLLL